MDEEQLITAQTLATKLISVKESLDRINEKRDALMSQSYEYESQLLDSLGEVAKVTYKVKGKAVTVVKARGEASKIFVTDLIQ